MNCCLYFLKVKIKSVVYNVGVLKHFAPRDMVWSGDIETFSLLRYGQFYKDFELYQVFILNCFKYFDQKKSDNFCPKMFQYPHIIYYQRTFLQLLSKNWFCIFLLIFGHPIPPSFGMPRCWH